jgi:WhiB family redox-sensing transcriptional regulator
MNVFRDSARWIGRAACRGLPAILFFPPPGTPSDAALEVCACCPVRPECARHAELNGEVYGIWGGRTEIERAHDSPQRSDVAVGIGRRRPGPPSAVDDDRLIELIWSLDPDQPAAARLDALHNEIEHLRAENAILRDRVARTLGQRRVEPQPPQQRHVYDTQPQQPPHLNGTPSR